MTISEIVSEIRDICGGDANTEQLDNTTLLRRINSAYREVVAMIQNCDGLWQFDDANYTNFPIGTTTLIAGQRDYTFASDVLEVEAVSVRDSAGNYQPLYPIDHSQMESDPDELYKTNGMPFYYDKIGNSILLYPAPAAGSVTLTQGLKVTFKRTASVFTAAELSTGTKEPGFAVPYHRIIPLKASLPFLVKYIPSETSHVRVEIAELTKELLNHYSRREQDRRKVMRMGGISYV